MPEKSAAELALQKKYELLNKRKLQSSQDKNAKGSGGRLKLQKKSETFRPESPNIDPVRQAAIEALKQRRAAAANLNAPKPFEHSKLEQTRPSATPNAVPDAIGAEEQKKIKLKFVIPKKSQAPEQDAAAITTIKVTNTISSIPKQEKTTERRTIAAPVVKKRPMVHRPSHQLKIEARSSPSSQLLDVEQPSSQQHIDASQIHSAHGAAHPVTEPSVEAPSPYGGPSHYGGPSIPSIPQLFVGDLPDHFTSENLFEFFSAFHDVVDARVIPSFCYGFVTFSNFEDAQAVLDFQAQQSIQVEDRELRISWVRENGGPGGSGYGGGYGSGAWGGRQNGAVGSQGGEHYKTREARRAAAQVAEQISQHDLDEVNLSGSPPSRNLVFYDDL